jgi:hypothetical protein
MCFFGGGSGGAKAQAAQQQQQADEARADADKNAAALTTGKANIDSAFSGFDDNFFNGLAKNYTDYATPQLEGQYGLAKKNITYALARNGTTRSSIAGDEFGQLAKQYATNQTGIAGTGASYASKARSDVQSNKADVTNQLFASNEADSANVAALSAAKSLATPPSFSPLGNLFTNISAVAAQNKLASDASGGYGGGARLYNTGTSAYGVS